MKIKNLMAFCLSLSLAVAPIAIADTEVMDPDTETQETDETPAADEQTDDEDILDSIMADANDVKLKYEYEVLLTDDYELPEKIVESEEHRPIYSANDVSHFYFLQQINGAQPVSSAMVEYAKELVRVLNDKKKVQAYLEKAAIIGFITKKGRYSVTMDFYADSATNEARYVGPLQLCLMEAEDNLLYNNKDLARNTLHGFYLTFMKDRTKAASGDYKGIFKYNTSVEWKKGLPYKVKCSVDFTPSKSKLSKKEKK